MMHRDALRRLMPDNAFERGNFRIILRAGKKFESLREERGRKKCDYKSAAKQSHRQSPAGKRGRALTRGKKCLLSLFKHHFISIVVSTSKDTNLVWEGFIHKSVLIIYASRPAAGKLVFQRLWVTDSGERLALHFFDQLDNAQGFLTISLDPPSQVFESGGIKFQVSHRRPPARSRNRAALHRAGVVSCFCF